MSKFVNEEEALKLVASIQNNTPVDTGALKASVQIGYVNQNEMMILVGANSSSGNMARGRRSPSQYVRYVNEGYPRGTRNEYVNKGFIERGVKAWASQLKTNDSNEDDSMNWLIE